MLNMPLMRDTGPGTNSLPIKWCSCLLHRGAHIDSGSRSRVYSICWQKRTFHLAAQITYEIYKHTHTQRTNGGTRNCQDWNKGMQISFYIQAGHHLIAIGPIKPDWLYKATYEYWQLISVVAHGTQPFPSNNISIDNLCEKNDLLLCH